MKEKVYDFIYLNSNRYLSLHCLQTFYWAIIIFPLTMGSMGNRCNPVHRREWEIFVSACFCHRLEFRLLDICSDRQK